MYSRPRFKSRLLPLLLVFIIAALLPGCQGKGNTPEPSATPPEAAQPAAKMPLTVYYIKYTENDSNLVREIHQVNQSPEVARAALEELIKGNPETPGAVRVLPAGTQVLGVRIDPSGLATVDFSPEVLSANVGSAGEALGIASIVNTLTEFPTINRVAFSVNGQVDSRTKDWWGHVGLYEQPFKRDLSKVYEPAIWITSPLPSQQIKSQVEVQGSAMVFEAAVCARVVDETGRVLAQGYTTASEGAPGRGDFKLTLDFNPTAPGKGTVEAYSTSPKDGSIINLYRVPVTW
ncbi:MAG: spore gernimation protein [Firmicutes bacterium]|nr:spore gernimation protein [Bacillota bacterium]